MVLTRTLLLLDVANGTKIVHSGVFALFENQTVEFERNIKTQSWGKGTFNLERRKGLPKKK